jgi:UDP-glucose 4-epimerase
MSADPSYMRAYRNMRVLVTGGAGAIGSTLCRVLTGLGAMVTVLDDLSSSDCRSLIGLPNCQFVKGSILDPEALARVFSPEPQLVFHLAALFANQNSVEHPEQDLMVNGLGTLRVLQAAQAARVDRVIYAATSCAVYGDVAQMPITEDACSLDLHTPYQITKLLGELYCNYFKSFYQLKTVRVRFFNSYGPGEVPGRYRNVIPNFIYWALQQQPLRITGTGEETRDWTYVEDIVDGLLRAGVVDGVIGEVFNLASGRETKVIELARQVNEITDNKAGIIHAERRNWDTHNRRWASIDKARRFLGYEPIIDLHSGLQRTVDWFRRNWTSILSGAQF